MRESSTQPILPVPSGLPSLRSMYMMHFTAVSLLSDCGAADHLSELNACRDCDTMGAAGVVTQEIMTSLTLTFIAAGCIVAGTLAGLSVADSIAGEPSL